MIRVLFGEVREGRLLRLPYLGYSLLLLLVFLGSVAAIVLAVGAGEHLMGGDLQQAQHRLGAWLSLPVLAVFGVLGAAMIFSGLNIMAKRIRDVGLPGWWGVLAIVVASGFVSGAVSEQAGSGLQTLAWIALLLVPSDSFSRGTRPSV